MPLLEINQVHRISATIRLDATTAAQLDQYAAFLRASADEVVDKVLGYVFSKDREFQDFLRTPEAGHVRSSLRIRHAAGNGGRRLELAFEYGKFRKPSHIPTR
jgi:23S rRNA maturation-related 3'-5' exoribonuclease YhaM